MAFVGKIPLRTHVVTESDDVVSLAKKYAGAVAEKGDVIALSESVVAITQRRAVLPETVRPGLLAKFLCRFPAKHGSLATPQAMQLAIQEVGHFRILLGAAAAALGKLFGVRGLFYRVAGRQLAFIDDVAGTMYPYERHIVLGPADPEKVVNAVKAATGVDCAVVDVNDIGCVDVIAKTPGVDEKELVEALRDNPFGNDDQCTPIVVLKSLRQGRAID